MHFDGSWNRLGFVLHAGEIILAGGRSSEAGSATLCEILACCWGLKMVGNATGSGGFCIEGDSATALARVGGESGCLLPVLLSARRIVA